MSPPFADGGFVIAPSRGARQDRPVGHEGGDVGAVRVVAAVGEVAESGGGVGDGLVVAEDGLVEADDEFEDRGGDGDAGDADLLAQNIGAVEDVVVGAGVEEKGGHADGVPGLAQGEAGDEMAGVR